jgi:hypothetical protein
LNGGLWTLLKMPDAALSDKLIIQVGLAAVGERQ